MKLNTICTTLAAITLAASSSTAYAQEKNLTVVAVNVHEAAMRGVGVEGGKDVLAEFEQQSGTTVSINIETGTGIQDALPRLGTLNNIDEDIIFISQLSANPRIAAFLEPLDTYLATSPIEGFPQDWVQAPVNAGTIDGKSYLLPLRCGVWIGWGNKQYLADAGFANAPRTPEELYEAAKQATQIKPNGEQVYGFAIRGAIDQVPSGLATVAAMFGGQIINEAGEVVVNSAETVKAVELLRKMYVEGIMPPNWTSVDVDELFATGRLAMVISNDNYTTRFEGADALGSGGTLPFHIPLEDALRTDEVDYASSQAFYWGAGILKGSSDKELAFELLRHLAQTSVAEEMLENRNPPCKTALLADLGETFPASAVGADTLAISKAPLPGHPRLREASDALAIAVQEVVVNGAPAQETMDRAAEELKEIYN